MSNQWAGEIVASLHVNKIKQKELAKEMDLTEEYVSMILCGKKSSVGMEERMKAAIESIVIKKRGSDGK